MAWAVFVNLTAAYDTVGDRGLTRTLLWLLPDRHVCRGVTRLDGAWGKKQVWRPHVQTWGLSEANVLRWRKYLWHCWDFSAPQAVIRRHCSNLAPPKWFSALGFVPTLLSRRYAPARMVQSDFRLQMKESIRNVS